MDEAEEVEAARTLVGLVLAVEAGDREAETALWYGGDGPVDRDRLLAVACRMIFDLAADLGDRLDPPESAEDVLRAIALHVAG